MTVIFLILIGLAAFAVILVAQSGIDRLAKKSADAGGRKIPSSMIGQRNALYRECLRAAAEGRFSHDYLVYRLKGSDLTLTDETWAYGIQPHFPLSRDQGFAFTPNQSQELAKLLSLLREDAQSKEFIKVLKELRGEK